jgi:hypothetical protein
VLGCLLSTVAACSSAAAPPRAPGASETGIVTGARLAAEDEPTPAYAREDLDHAIEAERAAIAHAEEQLATAEADPHPDDAFVAMRADLAVRRRFLASLEMCAQEGHRCPPRLDDPAWSYDPGGTADPKLDARLRFDRADWQRIAEELQGRACACRSATCVDSMFAAIEALEARPIADVRGDETASGWIAHARECLYRLRGELR